MKIQRFTFNMFGVNTYIVWDEDSHEAAIIDPGMISDIERNSIDDFIRDNGLKVAHLINTHLHIDHVFGDSYVKNRYDVKIEANPADNMLGANLKAQSRMFGLDEEVGPLTAEVPLHEGDTLMLGDEALKVLQVPGHSPGSIVLYAPQSGFVVVGDVLFERSVGRTDLPGGNARQLLEGINNKLFTLPPDTVVYPGHGPETTIGDERRANPFFH